MPINGVEDRSGREIRLLLLVIAVAVAGLLVLARFRFPEAEIVRVSPTPNPLERLATRAPFDELAAAIAEGSSRVAPWLAVVELESTPEKTPSKKARVSAPAEPQRLAVPALRVRPDITIAHAPPGFSPVKLAGGPAQALGADPVRQVALSGPADNAAPPGGPGAVADFANAIAGFAGSTYVLAAEPAAGAAALRPVFIPRVDPVAAEHWPAPLLQIGGEPQIKAGTFLFSIDGRVIGLVVPLSAGVAIVDAAMLDRLTVELSGNRQ